MSIFQLNGITGNPSYRTNYLLDRTGATYRNRTFLEGQLISNNATSHAAVLTGLAHESTTYALIQAMLKGWVKRIKESIKMIGLFNDISS